VKALERMTLVEVAHVLGLPTPAHDVSIRGVSTDSRTVKEGDLFFALVGPNFNGHEFVELAADKDAAAAVVSEPVTADLPLLHVPDVRRALGQVARARRDAFHGPVIGITGSNGKTTTKEMITSILRERGAVLATQGNLNNEIGVPLTIMRMEQTDTFAVIEMGASHSGEIAYLAGISRPDVGLVTNAGAAHLEGFGSIEGVARAKAELFTALAPNGIAVINADDVYAPIWFEMSKHCRHMSFGVDQTSANVSARDAQFDAECTRFVLVANGEEISIRLAVLGIHNVRNALAAAAASIAAGATLSDVKAGLESFSPAKGRLQQKAGLKGARILDDSYNANPDSFHAGIDVLAAYPGMRITIMGDMLELGDGAHAAHRELGLYAKRKGIDVLLGVGTMTAAAVEGFGPGAIHFETQQALVAHLVDRLSESVTLLVKGSRGSHMENVVNALLQTK